MADSVETAPAAGDPERNCNCQASRRQSRSRAGGRAPALGSRASWGPEMTNGSSGRAGACWRPAKWQASAPLHKQVAPRLASLVARLQVRACLVFLIVSATSQAQPSNRINEAPRQQLRAIAPLQLIAAGAHSAATRNGPGELKWAAGPLVPVAWQAGAMGPS